MTFKVEDVLNRVYERCRWKNLHKRKEPSTVPDENLSMLH